MNMFRSLIDSVSPALANTMLGVGLFPTHEIFPSDAVCVSHEKKQFRFPKSKKVRIRKKWSKKSNNFKWVEVRKIVSIGNIIYMPSKQFYEYKEAMLKRISACP